MRAVESRRVLAVGITSFAVALAAAAPSLPANAALPRTTVTGTVTLEGRPVVGIRVGTWAPGKGVLTSTTTDSAGRFSLRPPSAVAVDAFAGSSPGSNRAVSAVGPQHLVRGVIGAHAPTALAAPLFQAVTRARPARLGGGRPLAFRLQGAARFTASSPLLGRFSDVTGEILVEHGSGLYGPSYAASEAGVVTSGWLVPGRYHLYWAPKPPSLPTRTWVRLPPGTTALEVPDFTGPGRTGATLTIHGTSGGGPLPEGVPIVGGSGTSASAAPDTDATGSLVEHAVEPGAYRFTFGQRFDDPDEGLDGPPSSDDYLVRTVAVTVRPGDTAVTATVDLEPASKVVGSVVVPAGASALVYAEDSTGRVVRSGGVENGAFTLGGLPAGRYTVFAVDLTHRRYDSATVSLPAATSTHDTPTRISRVLDPTAPELTIRGSVRGGRDGRIDLRSPTVHGASLYAVGDDYGASGAYSIRTIPGRFGVLVDEAKRFEKHVAVSVFATSGRHDYPVGPKWATVTGRFTVHGHAVRLGLAAETAGGRQVSLDPVGSRGRSTAHEVRAGRYSWTRALTPLPALDGPWYYGVPKGSFVVRAGTTTDLGRRSVAIHG